MNREEKKTILRDIIKTKKDDRTGKQINTMFDSTREPLGYTYQFQINQKNYKHGAFAKKNLSKVGKEVLKNAEKYFEMVDKIR